MLTTRPIWALPACVARFGYVREDEAQRKACKRLATTLQYVYLTTLGGAGHADAPKARASC